MVERQLLVEGRAVPIGGRAFDVLLDLLTHRNRLVQKSELLDRVWAGLVVEENNLATQISALRKWLGPNAIATIPGRGYRFSARVQVDSGAAVPQRPAAAQPVQEGATRPPPSPKTNLPARPPALIGRTADLDAVRLLVGRHRLVTIVGPGGVGKTRLAEALAFEQAHDGSYGHGVCWLSLAPLSEAVSVPGAIADALGVSLGTGEPLALLQEALAPLCLLLVLDNAEHLLAAAARVVEAMQRAAPQVRIVVTSQAPLHLQEERVHRLRGLDVPDGAVLPADALSSGAVALFVDRATAADSRFALDTENVATVVAICRALDGVALAIELAAARVRTLGVLALAASLDERLRLLVRPANGGVAPRQRTLHAALAWSHALLDEAEKAVFRRLAVLPASASLATVQALLVDDEAEAPAGPSDIRLDRWQVLDALSGLIDRSLVELVADDEPSVDPRYRLLESPRLFAAERLEAAGEKALLQARHAAVVAAAFDRVWAARWDGSMRVDRWRAILQPDLDSARAALNWARAHAETLTTLTIGPTMIHALSWSLHDERAAIARTLRTHLSDEALPVPLRLRAASAICTFLLGSRAMDMRETAAQAVALARRLDDRAGLYEALSHLSCAEARLGDPERSTVALAEMRSLEDPAWAPQRLAIGADAEYLAGRADPARALALTRRQAALNHRAGGATWKALLNLVDAELVAGHAHAAAACGEELLAQLGDSRDERGMAYARLNLTAVWLELGDAKRARAMAEAGWPMGPRFDLQAYWADVLALFAARDGRPRQAARLAGYSDACYGRHQDARIGNEAKAYAQAVAVSRAALGEAAFDRLHALGQALGDGDVAAHALASADR